MAQSVIVGWDLAQSWVRVNSGSGFVAHSSPKKVPIRSEILQLHLNVSRIMCPDVSFLD